MFVATPVPRSHLYGWVVASPQTDLPLPRFADKDFIPEMLQSMWVATQEYPASPPSLASQSLCLDLDAMSSEGAEGGRGGAPAVDTVVISDQERTVISIDSSDTDPEEVDCLFNFQSELVPPAVSEGVVESPSHYPIPVTPVELSAVSSVLISPSVPGYNRICSSYGARETCVVCSIVPSDGNGVVSFGDDGWAMPYNFSFVYHDSGVPLVVFPLYPLPAGMVLMPMPPSDQSSSSSRREHRFAAVSSSCDLSREDPFDAYSALLDTGDHPLVSMGLPGCPYRMTSYAGTDTANVDPVYGIQLHHPRFLEFIGAPESARLLNRSSYFWIQTMDREDAVAAALRLQRDAGLMASNLQVLGQFATSLDRMSCEVLRLAIGLEIFLQ